MKYRLYSTLMFSLSLNAAFAQQAPSTPSNTPPLSPKTETPKVVTPSTPPPSGLGKQVSTKKTPPIPKVVLPKPKEVVEQAVSNIEDTQLTEKQYKRLKTVYVRRSRQQASPYISPPKPITRTLVVNLDPGVSPPVLRLTRGQQSSIVFSDTSGQPWFIDNVSLNRTAFSDGHDNQNASSQQNPTNILTLEPLNPASYGNVTVTLKGLSTPIIFVLTSAQTEVDMRVDAKVPGHNPDANSSITLNSMPGIDTALPYFLDRVPPKEAKQLKVTGLEGTEAWFYQDNLYVRVKADAQYPAYLSAARSTSGVSVYRYASRYNSLTFLTEGKAVTVFIDE